jgi:hypothetical protein
LVLQYITLGIVNLKKIITVSLCGITMSVYKIKFDVNWGASERDREGFKKK